MRCPSCGSRIEMPVVGDDGCAHGDDERWAAAVFADIEAGRPLWRCHEPSEILPAEVRTAEGCAEESVGPARGCSAMIWLAILSVAALVAWRLLA